MCWGCGKAENECADNVGCKLADNEGLEDFDGALCDESTSDESTDDGLFDDDSMDEKKEMVQTGSTARTVKLTSPDMSWLQQQCTSDFALARALRDHQISNSLSKCQPPASLNQRTSQATIRDCKQAEDLCKQELGAKDPARVIARSDRRDARALYMVDVADEPEYHHSTCSHPYVSANADASITCNSYLECHYCWTRVRIARVRLCEKGPAYQSKAGSTTPRYSNVARRGQGNRAPPEYDARPEAYICTHCGVMVCANCRLAMFATEPSSSMEISRW